jgi:hypothetical protein
VLSESRAEPSRQAGGKAFWWRLTDNLFRRLGWFLLPVVAMAVLGVVQANKTAQLFQSTGTLSASINPLVPNPAIDGINSQFWETPAQATSRSLNERLGTETFLEAIVKEAGLEQSVASGFVQLPVVRQSIWATANGESILAVHAQWGNPQTSYELARATISQFQKFLRDTASSKASAAEQYYTTQLETLERQHAEAQQSLRTYVDGLDLTQDSQDPLVDVDIAQLQDAVTNLQDKITAAEENIDEAKLLRNQETSAASQSISVIDAPKVPSAPQSTVMKRIMLVMSFLLLGVVISFAALLVTTALDHTVSSTADLLAIPGIALVATVPPVRIGSGENGKRSIVPGRGRRRRPATTRVA